jgi:hypothetical protein
MWVKAMREKEHREIIARRLNLLKKIFEDTRPTTEILNGCVYEVPPDEDIKEATTRDRNRLGDFIQRLLNSGNWRMAS